MDPIAERVLVFVIGLVTGSFLNVVRYRLPRRRSVVFGRSACPRCERTIAWYDNIPLASFIILGGKCRHCGWRIPSIYPVIEIGTGLAFLLVWTAYPPLEAVAYLVLTSLVIACAGVDMDLRLIPDKLTIPGTVIGLVFAVTLLRQGSIPAR